MRALFWLLLLFVSAVTLALLAGNNQVMLTMYLPPNTAIDFSLNFALAAIICTFAILLILLRSASALRKLPQKARRWRIQQRERAMHAHMLDALSHYLAGRFARARKSAQHALRHESELYDTTGAHSEPADTPLPYRQQLRTQAHFIVAQSSHALQDQPARDQAMQQAQQEAASVRGETAQETRDGLHLRAASWLLDDHAPHQALQQLNALPQGASRRVQALRIKLKAARRLGQSKLALETGRTLVRHKAFSEEAGKAIMAKLASDMIASASDPQQLETFWKKLDKTERAQPDVALQAAQRMIALQGNIEQARIWLLPVWELYAAQPENLSPKQRSQLINALQSSDQAIDNTWLQRIEAAHLRAPQHAELQYLMGMACLQRQLWGKAQQLLTQATKGLQNDPALLRNAWRALARIAETRQDTAQASAAWKQAALVE